MQKVVGSNPISRFSGLGSTEPLSGSADRATTLLWVGLTFRHGIRVRHVAALRPFHRSPRAPLSSAGTALRQLGDGLVGSRISETFLPQLYANERVLDGGLPGWSQLG